ncbi:MAG: hypothetical protein ACI308_02450 [Muribaculaceae bacterium]
MNNGIKICFVCSGNACRSPFAEVVTRRLLADEHIEGVEVYSLGTLDWGSNPRDAAMAYEASQLGYTMDGYTTHMTAEALNAADVIVCFQDNHRNAITQELSYSHWNRIVMFNKLAFGTEDGVEDPNFCSPQVYKRVASHIELGCRNIVRLIAEGALPFA